MIRPSRSTRSRHAAASPPSRPTHRAGPRASSLLLAAGVALLLAACGGGESPETAGDGGASPESAASSTAPGPGVCDDLAAIPADSMETRESGLRVLDREEGEGPEAAAGDTVSVHYVGCLTDGEKFDASYDRNRPLDFTLGAGRVIEGWEQGVRGMRPGGVRILRIPPELGYGERGTGPIPPDATLLFRVELLSIGQEGGAGSG